MRFRVEVQTIYGRIIVDDVIADNEEEAFEMAIEEIKQELDCSKVGSIDFISNN